MKCDNKEASSSVEFITILWSIRMARNNQAFRNVNISPLSIIHFAGDCVKRWIMSDKKDRIETPKESESGNDLFWSMGTAVDRVDGN